MTAPAADFERRSEMMDRLVFVWIECVLIAWQIKLLSQSCLNGAAQAE